MILEDYLEDTDVLSFFNKDEVLAESFYRLIKIKNFDKAFSVAKNYINTNFLKEICYISNSLVCDYFLENFNFSVDRIALLKKEDFINILDSKKISLENLIASDGNINQNTVNKLLCINLSIFLSKRHKSERRKLIDDIIDRLSSSKVYDPNYIVINYVDSLFLSLIQNSISNEEPYKYKDKIELFFQTNLNDFEGILLQFYSLYKTVFIDKDIITVSLFDIKNLADYNYLITFLENEIQFDKLVKVFKT